jgi:hypothetical protein
MCSRDVNTTLPTATIPSFADCLTYDGKGLLANFVIWGDVIRIADIEFIDLRLRHKLLNLNSSFAFNGHSFEFLGGHIDVFAFGDLVALNDVGLLHFIAGRSLGCSQG